VAAGLRAHGQLTLSWPRLTWPALAWRHAGPWPRKISATSGAGRDIAADGYAGKRVFLLLSGLYARLRQQVERALNAIPIAMRTSASKRIGKRLNDTLSLAQSRPQNSGLVIPGRREAASPE